MWGHLHPENNDENSKSLTTLTVVYDYELDNNDNERWWKVQGCLDLLRRGKGWGLPIGCTPPLPESIDDDDDELLYYIIFIILYYIILVYKDVVYNNYDHGDDGNGGYASLPPENPFKTHFKKGLESW